MRPTLLALLEWGDRYLADPQGPSVIVRYRPADGACELLRRAGQIVLECAAGHSHLAPEDICRTPGPGARFVESSLDISGTTAHEYWTITDRQSGWRGRDWAP
ncbi:hypothetical protein [Amycolatopsis dongchuanensis]|uniref:Uncharacterized protein n=1 Tax=Amycolatopsis dongchuanensis TaxID=1070866 RepID=A0ABP9PRK7_9PSEU